MGVDGVATRVYLGVVEKNGIKLEWIFDGVRILITENRDAKKRPHPCKTGKNGAPKFKNRKPNSKTKTTSKAKSRLQGQRRLGGLLGGARALLGDF
jgi:hypothetical protein